MRVAVVAGPDPGHSFPAIALCRLFSAAGDTPTLLTGTEWLDTARAAGVDAVELAGLDPAAEDDDRDAGAKIHRRAARMAVLNLPQLRELAPDLVVEIASPTQYRPDLADKARLWLDRGVHLVWVVWPERRELDIWTSGVTEPRTLIDDDALEGGDVIPGFRATLSQLW